MLRDVLAAEHGGDLEGDGVAALERVAGAARAAAISVNAFSVAATKAATRASSSSTSRVIVINLAGKPLQLYDRVSGVREHIENMIKAHKHHLASDRTSCHSALANQLRFIFHSAAYAVLHDWSAAAPQRSPRRAAPFDTLRMHLIKIGACVVELAARIKVLLRTVHPNRVILRHLDGAFAPSGP